jgi:hypothetical protein
MRKIAIALVLFQLFSCAKQPVVTTHPEKKQENETLQHDTPQTPKTNYLKIGGAIVGILAIGALIFLNTAYCCSRKEEKWLILTLTDPLEEAKKRAKERMEQDKKIAEEIAKQDKRDIDRIVKSSALWLWYTYHDIGEFILEVFSNMGTLEAILKTHLLQYTPLDIMRKARPGETNLSCARLCAKIGIDKKVAEAQEANPHLPMSEVFKNIETGKCFIGNLVRIMNVYERNLELYRRDIDKLGHQMAPYMMNATASIVYYFEFKEALLRSEK